MDIAFTSNILLFLVFSQYKEKKSKMGSIGRILVYGGNGALGRVLVSSFKAKKYWICSVDLTTNNEADANVTISELNNWERQNDEVQAGVTEAIKDEKFDGIFCVAGGWAGGNAKSKALIRNTNLMWMQSVWSSTISASLACKHLKEGGILTLPGAAPAVDGTPGMVGYGMAKAAVHQLTQSLGNDCGLPNDAKALCILPSTLDTPMNRKWMASADKSSWTSLEYVSELFDGWMNKKDVPASGSLVKINTVDSVSSTKVI